MRRFVLLSLLATFAVPGLALAQAAPNTSPAMQAPAAPPGPLDHSGHDHAAMLQKMHDRFNAANTTHDGHLTLAQATAAGLKPVVAHFAEIDTAKRGYVTFNQVQAWHMDEMAKRLEKKADALRAAG
ncbi:MAG TPA: hypothetical protein PK231_10720 [Acidocella sp.]|nr:MAG: hypothetical protein B7Z77_06305 [Acidocella sp. 20-58-15]HQT39889.1 hypothetical protein [Acidocella sp.]